MWSSALRFPSEVPVRAVAFRVVAPEVTDLATHHRVDSGPARNVTQDTPSLSPAS